MNDRRMFPLCHVTFLFGILLFLCVHGSAKVLTSSLRQSFDPCRDTPRVRGPCYANLRRFTFEFGRCVEFYYGGCLGSTNRFNSFVECERRCLGGPCNQTPGVSGPCWGNFPRYTYVPIFDTCQAFRYGGCEGNDNRFRFLNDCINRCVGRRG